MTSTRVWLVTGSPSVNLTFGRTLIVQALKSALGVTVSARNGWYLPSSPRSMIGSYSRCPYVMPSLSQVLNGGSRPGSSASMPTMMLPPATGLAVSVPLPPPAAGVFFLLLPHAVATRAAAATSAMRRMAGRPLCARVLRCITALSPPVGCRSGHDMTTRQDARAIGTTGRTAEVYGTRRAVSDHPPHPGPRHLTGLGRFARSVRL